MQFVSQVSWSDLCTLATLAETGDFRKRISRALIPRFLSTTMKRKFCVVVVVKNAVSAETLLCGAAFFLLFRIASVAVAAAVAAVPTPLRNGNDKKPAKNRQLEA